MPFFRSCLAQIRLLTVFLAVVFPAAIIAIVLPGLHRRRTFAHHASRLAFRLTGMPITIVGRDHLPTGACLIVANHASYLDGIVMMAVAPPRFTFLIKSEMSEAPFIGLLLRRLGMAFVARTDTTAAAGAARRLINAARNGNAIGVFPEGTFTREPGLRDFRLGGFLAAARANLPVVPAAIRGTRCILPAGAKLVRPRPIHVTLLPAIVAGREGRGAAEELRVAARQAILKYCGEPDKSKSS